MPKSDSDPELLSTRTQKLLRSHGMSQASLAHLIGVNPAHMSRLLNGARPFTLRQVEEIAKALSITVADLVVGTDHADDVKAMGTLVPRELYEAVLEQVAAARLQSQEAGAVAARAAEELRIVAAQLADSDGQRASLAALQVSAQAERDAAVASGSTTIRERDEARVIAEAARRDLDSQSLQLREARAQLDATRRAAAESASAARQSETTNAGLRAEVAQLRAALATANQRVIANFDAYKQREAEVIALRGAVKKADSRAAGVSILSALVGLGLGVAATGKE